MINLIEIQNSMDDLEAYQKQFKKSWNRSHIWNDYLDYNNSET